MSTHLSSFFLQPCLILRICFYYPRGTIQRLPQKSCFCWKFVRPTSPAELLKPESPRARRSLINICYCKSIFRLKNSQKRFPIHLKKPEKENQPQKSRKVSRVYVHQAPCAGTPIQCLEEPL